MTTLAKIILISVDNDSTTRGSNIVNAYLYFFNDKNNSLPNDGQRTNQL